MQLIKMIIWNIIHYSYIILFIIKLNHYVNYVYSVYVYIFICTIYNHINLHKYMFIYNYNI